MSLRAVCTILDREPGRLSELEAALGVSLRRDVRGEDAWLLRRDLPTPGIAFIFAAFIGIDLPRDPDPLIAELRLFTTEIDCRAQALALLGAAEQRGGETTFDPYHQREPTTSPVYEAWSRGRGVFTMHGDRTKFYWGQHDQVFADTRTPAEEAALLDHVVTLLGGPIDHARIARAFSPLVMDGRYPEITATGTTWKLTVRPIAEAARYLELALRPDLPVAHLIRALGLPPVLVATQGVHQQGRAVIDRQTLRSPIVNGNRVQITIEDRTLAESVIRVPGQRSYELGTDTRMMHVRVDVGQT